MDISFCTEALEVALAQGNQTVSYVVSMTHLSFDTKVHMLNRNVQDFKSGKENDLVDVNNNLHTFSPLINFSINLKVGMLNIKGSQSLKNETVAADHGPNIQTVVEKRLVYSS